MKRFLLPLMIAAMLLFSACADNTSLPPVADGDTETDRTDLDTEHAPDGDIEGRADSDAEPEQETATDGDRDADLDPDLDAEEEAEAEPEPVPVAFTILADTHKIVIASDASASEQRAASALKDALDAVLGADVPILNEAPGDDGGMIVIGQGDIARSLGVDPSEQELGEQGYAIRSTDKHLIIAGTPGAGTMYGVQRFMEEVIGMRWYAPGVSHTPSLSAIDVPQADRIVTPAFLWRHTSYAWPGKDDAFLANMGDNSGDKTADSEFGLEHAHDGRCHSYYRFISPDEYFDEHPEYFSEIGGVRIREETQLCLTNPDVLDIVTQKMLQRMESMPNVRQHNFSQMDHYNACTCPACSAMNAQYKTQGGTQFWFVNELAKRTSQVYPDKLIGTLAYMYTEEPPQGLDMHPNVAVWLCHMFPSCDSHPIDECPLDAEYKRRAETWAEISDHLYMWHYIVDFMHYYNPFPNFRAMASDMRFYRDIGVEGVYLQGMGHGGGGGEWSLLRPYYGMHLLWNPDVNPKLLRRDFLKGYYGQAWQPLENYIEMLHDKVEDEGIHMHLYTNPAQGYLSDEIMQQAHAYFDEAEAAVESDEEMLERVRVARMPLVYADTFPRMGYDIVDGRIKWRSEIAPLSVLNDFISRMNAHGFTTVREVAGDTATLSMLYMLIAANPKVVEISNDKLNIEIVPQLGGRALRILHKASGQYVTAYNVKENLYFPFAGGLEDRTGEMFRYYGWVEPANVSDHSARAITLSKETVDGFTLSRTMTLDESKAVLYVVSTLSNPGDTAREARLRSHLELELGDVISTRMRFTSLSGEAVDSDMSKVVENLREGIHFYDQDAPNGEWRFSGSKGLNVIQRFDNSQLDFTWVYSYPQTLGEVELELWSKRTVLAPGESIQIEQEIEISANE